MSRRRPPQRRRGQRGNAAQRQGGTPPSTVSPPQAPAKPRGAAKPAARSAQAKATKRPSQGRRMGLRRRRGLWPGVAITAILAIGGALGVVFALGGTTAPPAAAGTLLAPVSTSVSGQPVDGMQCTTHEQLAHQIHAHLAVYVNGAARTIPAGVGIPPPRAEESSAAGGDVVSGSCFYALDTHTADGVVHVGSTVQQTYTVGNFFDVWGIALDAGHVGPAAGTVIAYVNGQRYADDVSSIPLNNHELIQLDINGDVSPQAYTFPAGD